MCAPVLALHALQYGSACHCITEYIAEQELLLCSTSVSAVHAVDRNLCDFVDIVSSHVCRWRPQAYYGLQKMSFADEHKNVCPH